MPERLPLPDGEAWQEIDGQNQWMTWSDFYFVFNAISEQRHANSLVELGHTMRALRVPLSGVTGGAWETYCNQLATSRGLAPNTIRKIMRMHGPLWKWAMRREIISPAEYSRIESLKAPRGSTDKPQPRPHAVAEVQAVFVAIEKKFQPITAHQMERFAKGQVRYGQDMMDHGSRLAWRLITMLMLHGGLRLREVERTTVNDCHPDNETLVARGKSPNGVPKLRGVPMTETLREALREYLRYRALVFRHFRVEPHESLLIRMQTRAGRGDRVHYATDPMSYDAIRQGMSRFGVSPHRIRHSAVTEWLRAGVPIQNVSKMVGHTNISMTQGYAELVNNDVTEAVRKAEAAFERNLARRYGDGALPREEREARTEEEVQSRLRRGLDPDLGIPLEKSVSEFLDAVRDQDPIQSASARDVAKTKAREDRHRDRLRSRSEAKV